MASVMPLRPMLASSIGAVTTRSTRRAISSSSKTFTPTQRPTVSSQFSRQTFRQARSRTYADQTIAPETKAAAKRGGFRTLRILWRLTQLSLVGGLGYMGYNIYMIKTPPEQFEPDPNKKTLVVLGKQCTVSSSRFF